MGKKVCAHVRMYGKNERQKTVYVRHVFMRGCMQDRVRTYANSPQEQGYMYEKPKKKHLAERSECIIEHLRDNL
jgi:hypothetical protein